MRIYQVKDKFFISQDLAYSYLNKYCNKGVLIKTHEIIETPLPQKVPIRLVYHYDRLLDILYFDYQKSLHEVSLSYDGLGEKFVPGRVYLVNLEKISNNIGLVLAHVDLEVNSVREISPNGNVNIKGSILSSYLITDTIKKNSIVLLDTKEEHLVTKL